MPLPLTPEAEHKLLATRFRDLDLRIPGSRLESGIAAFRQELARAGIVRLQPDFYLSTEWGVPFDSVSIAIPFYLARADLMSLHASQAGFLEGAGRGDLLRYLRHEMGHVVNYAYKLYDRPDWSETFGPISKDYEEDYRPQPFCVRYVSHLPGWYAQKHPDEDWAETIAVWLTPGRDWRTSYADWPLARAKLQWCDRVLPELNARDPLVTATDADEDVTTWDRTLLDFYTHYGEPEGDGSDGEAEEPAAFPPGLDDALQAIFEDVNDFEDKSSDAPRLPAGDLVRRLEFDLVAAAFRWTGHFPERTRPLVRHLAQRCDRLKQVYPADRESLAVVSLTTLVTMLAMNHVLHGRYQT